MRQSPAIRVFRSMKRRPSSSCVLTFAGLVAFTAGCSSSSAASDATATDDVKGGAVLKIEGNEMHLAAQIYDAMQVPEAVEDTDVLLVRVKRLSALTCERVTLRSEDPLSSSSSQHRCTVAAQPTQDELAEIYAGLSVVEIRGIGGMIGSDVKAVGPFLLMKGSNDAFRMLKNSGCKSVAGRATARTCLRFWASEVFVTYESANVADVSETDAARDRLAKLFEENAALLGAATKSTSDEIFGSSYVGALVQATDEGALAYFTLEDGEYAVPHGLAEVSLADIGEEGITTAHLDDWSLGISEVRSALETYCVSP